MNRPQLRQVSPTNRVVPMYRPGFGGQLLPLEMRPQTRFAPDPRALRRDGVPACRMFPLRFIGKLLAARLEMAFGR